jgi:putative ABC transport system substrate-binding protein
MKKIVLIVALLLVAGAVFLLSRKEERPVDPNTIVIGLLQTASFPALDQVREGFLTEMRALYGDRVRIEVQNAQGSIAQAQAIAVSFQANKNMAAFFAIATPATQALKMEIKDRPIVFAAVTDPQGLGLLSPEGNIAGTTDMADIPRQIYLVRSLLPQTKKVSILYTPGEPNSVHLVKQMQEELGRGGIHVRLVGANSQADVAASAQSAVRDTDLLLIPTDNNVVSAFSLVKQVASQANVPIVTTWTGESSGALMQFGVDYYHAGVQGAKIMEEALADVIPGSIPLMKPTSQVILNRQEIEKFKVVVPAELSTEVVYK